LNLSLLHLCDSLFPIGGFAYSDGLESATSEGTVADADALRDWLDVCLDHTYGRLEGPAVWRAWTAFRDAQWDALEALDEELTALRPSSSARRSSRAMGLRLLTTWQTLHPDARLAHAATLARDGRIGPVLPIAFACGCASTGIERRQSVEAFAYTRLAKNGVSRLFQQENVKTLDTYDNLPQVSGASGTLDIIISRFEVVHRESVLCDQSCRESLQNSSYLVDVDDVILLQL